MANVNAKLSLLIKGYISVAEGTVIKPSIAPTESVEDVSHENPESQNAIEQVFPIDNAIQSINIQRSSSGMRI